MHSATASRSVDLHTLSLGGRGKDDCSKAPEAERSAFSPFSAASNHLHLKVPSTKKPLQGANGRFHGEWSRRLKSWRAKTREGKLKEEGALKSRRE